MQFWVRRIQIETERTVLYLTLLYCNCYNKNTGIRKLSTSVGTLRYQPWANFRRLHLVLVVMKRTYTAPRWAFLPNFDPLSQWPSLPRVVLSTQMQLPCSALHFVTQALHAQDSLFLTWSAVLRMGQNHIFIRIYGVYIRFWPTLAALHTRCITVAPNAPCMTAVPIAMASLQSEPPALQAAVARDTQAAKDAQRHITRYALTRRA